MEKEQRRAKRIQLGLPAWFEIEPVSEAPRRGQHKIINLSHRGILFESDVPYPLSKTMMITLHLPTFDPPISSLLKVVRQEEMVPGKRYKIAGEFFSLQELDQKRLEQLVSRYSEEGEIPFWDRDTEQVVNLYQSLSSAEQKKVLNFIRSLKKK